MPADFYDYVRGLSDDVPPGYELRGLRVYRHLVRLGARQMLDACFPHLQASLGEQAWQALIEDFVRQSQWTSHFYGDMENEFHAYLARVVAEPHP
jgi:hypothetical protein